MPLSFAQERLWFLDRLAPGRATYNIPALHLRFGGELSPGLFEQVLAAIVERHEALRTRFVEMDGRPWQEIVPAYDFALPLIDLAALPAARREGEARKLTEAEARRPFDLERPGLLRVALFRLGTEDHALSIVVHHIVADGWSIGVLYGEIGAFLGAFRRGVAPALPELPVQPADFAVWQRGWLTGETLAAMLSPWRERLGTSPPVLELPADRPRPAVQSFRGRRLDFALDRRLTAALRRWSRAERATPFMVLLAAWSLLLSRLSGQDDLLLGFPVAGRSRPELSGLIGLFANTLVVRATFADDLHFRRLVRQVRTAILGALEAQDLPFERLVEELQPERGLSHGPLVQALFAFYAGAPDAMALPGLTVEAERAGTTATAKVDLTLSFFDPEGEGEMRATLEASRDLFDDATARRIAGQFQTLLRAGLAAPEVRLSRLPWLGAAERHQIQVEWNDTDVDTGAGEAPVHALFAARAAAAPDAVALAGSAGQCSYDELAARAGRLARHLAAAGVGPEVAVGLALERGPEAIVSLLAVLLAGGAYVPLDAAQPEAVQLGMLEQAGARLLLVERGHFGGYAGFPGPVLRLDELPAFGSAARLPDISADHLAYAMFTSGSTGRPKGVAIPHRGIVRLIRAGFPELGNGDTFLQLAPLSFDASTFEIWGALLAGGRLVLAPPGIPELAEVRALIAEQRVTTLWLTAGLFHAMAEGPLGELAGLASLLAGGDALSPPHAHKFRAALPGVRLVDGYGPTECTTFACLGTVKGADAAGGSIPIGRPLGDTRVRVVDRRLHPVPIGVSGELLLSGGGLARGYAGDPAETAWRFVPDPFGRASGGRLYRTGDRVRWRTDGRLEFLGRLDGQVKIRGFRVELAGVEAALAGHPAVEAAAAVVLGQDAGAKRLVAFVVPRDGELDEVALRAFLAEHLPGYMVPSAFVTLERLPLLGNGKVDRAALRQAGERAVEARPAPFTPPRTALEEQLATLWAALLGRSEVGVDDNFFALGGDSLLAIQLVARAAQAGISMTLAQLFAHQTVAELARAVIAAAAPPAAELDWGVGLVPPTPGSAWFFDRVAGDLSTPHHFSNTGLFEVRAALAPADLSRALGRLAFQHDALRLEAVASSAGWEIFCAGPEALAALVSVVDLGSLAEAAHRPAVLAVAAALLDRRDLAGPLARFVLFRRGPGRWPLLLAVLHHLVVDGPSFGLLREDLETLLGQASRGETLALPPRTTSFKAWAERQGELARDPAVRRQADDWLAMARAGSHPLPVDFPEPATPTGEVGRIVATLLASDTRTLLAGEGGAPGRFTSRLLAAVARAVAGWMGVRQVLLRQTVHGRNPPVAGVDLSRTVGWISSTFPVLFTVAAEATAAADAEADLARVPLGGLSYGLLRYLTGDPEIEARMREAMASPAATVNFLGRFDGAPPAAPPLLAAVPWPVGTAERPRRRDPQLRITGLVEGEPAELRLTFEYGRDFYRAETIERLAQGAIAALRRMIESPAARMR